MFYYAEIDNINTIVEILAEQPKSHKAKKILGNSVYYYCCGKDITPIMAFREKCSLFVYADIINYGLGDFETELSIMYGRLADNGNTLVDKIQTRIPRSNNKAEITKWTHEGGNAFYVLYIQGDVREVIDMVYADSSNIIQPRCICNYRYELSNGEPSNIVKRTELILGHCYSDKYEQIDEFAYYGDYDSAETKIPLYKRMYWYVY